MINYKIFEKFDKNLTDELNKIKLESFFYVFQLPEWIETISIYSQNSIKLKVIIVYNNEDIIFVAPLCIKRNYSCNELSWITSDITDYNNPIISKNFNFQQSDFMILWKKILKNLSSQCDLIFFSKNPEFIQSKNNPLIDTNYKYYQNSYQLNLNKFNYESFYNNKNNNKSKQTDRRKEKKLNLGGDLSYSYTNINQKNFNLVEELIFEKMTVYKENKEKTFSHNLVAKKYKSLVNHEISNFKFNISVLKKGNKKISSIFGVIFDKTYYYLIPIIHKTDLNKNSPGKFHIINLIHWAMNNDVNMIDFTAGDEMYKSNWSNNTFKMFYYIKFINLKGFIRFLFLNLYFKLRKFNFIKTIYRIIRI